MRRPALLRRFPTLRSSTASAPVLPEGTADRYPALAGDISVLDEVVGPVFEDSDRVALVHQNRYRRGQVVLILGAVVLSGFGGLQAALPERGWPGIVLAVLGIALAVVGQTAGELQTFEGFLEARVKAERLRATYFRYLSRTGRYATDQRETVLRRAVLLVKDGQEPR